jgi:hypothetical protein
VWPGAAVLLSHVTCGTAAAAIDSDAVPSHGSLVSPEITDSTSAAVVCSSSASSSHAAAAASIDPVPGPAYIRPEFTSGGNTAKCMSFPPEVVEASLYTSASGSP